MAKISALFIALALVGCASTSTVPTPVAPAQFVDAERIVPPGEIELIWSPAPERSVDRKEFVSGFGRRNSLMHCSGNQCRNERSLR